MSRLQLKSRMRNLLTFFPNMVALCGRLLTDRRVPNAEKMLVAAAIIYAVAPLDFLPDLIPFIGQVDDAYLIALTVLRLINRTDEQVIREHWRGGGNIRQLTESLAEIAPMLLPKKITKVLSSKVAIRPTKPGPEAKALLPVSVVVVDE
jgi:uncharacterized membrane protein YkvA (DUF1232 family)